MKDMGSLVEIKGCSYYFFFDETKPKLSTLIETVKGLEKLLSGEKFCKKEIYLISMLTDHGRLKIIEDNCLLTEEFLTDFFNDNHQINGWNVWSHFTMASDERR